MKTSTKVIIAVVSVLAIGGIAFAIYKSSKKDDAPAGGVTTTSTTSTSIEKKGLAEIAVGFIPGLGK